MDPTTKKLHTTTTSSSSSATAPPLPSDPLRFSTLCHPIHNHPTAPTPSDPPRFHAHLHPKSLALSAHADTSVLLKIKTKTQPNKQSKAEMEKPQRPNKEKQKIKHRKGPETAEEEPKRISVSLVNNGGGGSRRRSFCDTKIELSEFFSSVGARVVAVDMPPFMQIHAVSSARKTHDSLNKLSSKTLACTLKKEFDGVYGPAWHCIVGTSFGSFVTHSVGGFLYFSMDHKLYILLFKTSVQKAD